MTRSFNKYLTFLFKLMEVHDELNINAHSDLIKGSSLYTDKGDAIDEKLMTCGDDAVQALIDKRIALVNNALENKPTLADRFQAIMFR